MRTLDPVGVSLRKGNKLKRRQYLSKGFFIIINLECRVTCAKVYGL